VTHKQKKYLVLLGGDTERDFRALQEVLLITSVSCAADFAII